MVYLKNDIKHKASCYQSSKVIVDDLSRKCHNGGDTGRNSKTKFYLKRQ